MSEDGSLYHLAVYRTSATRAGYEASAVFGGAKVASGGSIRVAPAYITMWMTNRQLHTDPDEANKSVGRHNKVNG